MTTAEKIETIRNLAEVDFVSIWKGERAYINLKSCDKSFAGNRTHQFYVDIKSGGLVDQMGKGTTSRAFDAQRAIVAAAVL